MTTSEEWEGVIVAGAGPVGLFIALKLARAGIPVVVLEAQNEVNKSPRAIGNLWPIPKAFARAGILEDAKKVGVMGRGYQFRTLAGEAHKMPMSLRDTEHEQPYDLMLGQDTLAEIILAHMEKLPNAAVRWKHRVTNVAQDADTVTVTIDVEGEQRMLRARWLIAADGARSTVRGALGLDFEGFTWPDRFVATNVYCDFEAHGFEPPCFVMDPKHWAIIVKGNHQGLYRVAYGEDPNISEDEVRSRVGDRYTALLHGKGKWELANIGSYRVHERCATTFRVGRTLLAGDAAHICNPSGGLGLTGGIVDAVALTNALIQVIKENVSTDILNQYSDERRNIFLKFTSPTASENKRRLSEADPERRKHDLAAVRHLCGDPELTRRALHYTDGLIGDLSKELLN